MHAAPKVPFFVQALVAMFLGCAVGAVFGPQAAWLGSLATAIINLVRALAVPLLFLAVVEGVSDPELRWVSVRRLGGVCAVNAALACCIALALANGPDLTPWMRPLVASLGESAGKSLPQAVGWNEVLMSFIPKSVLQPFADNNIPAVVLLAALLGLTLRQLMRPASATAAEREGEATGAIADVETVQPADATRVALGRKLRAGAQQGLSVMMGMLQLLVQLLPIAVFAAVAKAVGEHGFHLFAGLAVFLAVCLFGFVLQMALVYSAWVKASGYSLRTFWGAAQEPVTFAFGVNSSLVTLPLTLRQLKRLGVRDTSARLGACVGTNFNNDGILLYQVLAALLFAQALGLEWSLGKQLGVAALALVSTLGVSGFPDAGIVALAIILPVVGLPPEFIALILPVDWILGRARSSVNVAGDMAVSVAIDGKADQPKGS